eukprot:EG_transcript_11667
MASPAASTGADVAAVLDLAVGHWKSAIVRALARFDLCDAIEELADAESRAAAAAAVAERCGTDPRATYRLLRSASALGLVVEHPDHRFSLTGAGRVLTSRSPLSAKNGVLLQSSPTFRELWMAFDDCLKSGKRVVQQVKGVDSIWKVMDQDPPLAELFNKAMTDVSRGQIRTVLDAYDLSGVESLVDVAGGEGLAACMALQRYPGLQARVADLPDVCAQTKVPAGLEGRLEVVPFDLFDAPSYPRDGDIYFLKNVLHDWDDAHSVAILQNTAAAMKPTSRVVIVEAGIPGPNQPGRGKLIDLHMLLLLDGAERTREGFEALAAAAGLWVSRLVETPNLWVVEMQPLP